MRLISNEEITNIKEEWDLIGNQIIKCNEALSNADYSQPVKPYLDFDDKKNRIIAMPARLGGSVNAAGIKWIASFPDNKKENLPRVSSTTIINDIKTGQTKAIINSEHLSSIRTVAVTYLMIREYMNNNDKKLFNIGIIGFGPIGQLHHKMISSMFKDSITSINVYDKNYRALDNLPLSEKNSNMKALIKKSDILITCTDVIEPYIDILPKEGSLVCNISLRDFCLFDENISPIIIVDSWEEVNRRGTNIENMVISKRINELDAISFADAIISFPKLNEHDFYFFNPMGMAVYDITVADLYLESYFRGKDNEEW